MPEALFQLAFIGPGGPEFIVVMLVLLMMFGAKDAPRIFRKINEMMNSIRKTADGFKREIMYYSDETFQNLENDLAAEQGGETDDVPATVEPADEVEDGDAQKT